jgi:choline dehydrogenase-like flavoprotein
MRGGAIRDHIAGISMIGEDMPQLANRVDLDPGVRDVYGFPVPRITHSPHRFELAASAYYGPRLQAICQAAPGAQLGIDIGLGGFGGPTTTRHVMGTARMGESADDSVVDGFGRVHEIEGLHVADGSVFVSSGGFNPTLTIMALALRTARAMR